MTNNQANILVREYKQVIETGAGDTPSVLLSDRHPRCYLSLATPGSSFRDGTQGEIRHEYSYISSLYTKHNRDDIQHNESR